MEKVEVSLATVEKVDPKLVFMGGGIDVLIAEHQAQLDGQKVDLETATGRQAVAAFAYKFSKDKTLVDNIGKNSIEDLTKTVKAFNAKRKEWRDSCDAFRDKARQPLTEWEEEQERIKAAELLKREIEKAEVDAYDADELWEHRKAKAEREAEEAAEKAIIEREHREEQIRKDAAEQAKRDAETERLIQIGKDRRTMLVSLNCPPSLSPVDTNHLASLTDSEFSQLVAEVDDYNKEQAKAAEAKAEFDKAQAVKEAEERAKAEAERKERERLEAERKEKSAAERKAANKRHRAKVEKEFTQDIISVCKAEGMEWDEDCIASIIMHINKGHIRHTTINY